MSNLAPLSGRTALVTGASRGIGRAIAEHLATQGARVVCSARRTETLEPVVAGLAALPAAADAKPSNAHGFIAMDMAALSSIEAGVAELTERFGGADIVVNNAGIAESKPFDRTDDEMWERMMTINALGVMRLCRLLIPPMIERGYGRNVIVASNAGLTGYAYSSAYCASKHAVLGMMRAIALEIARSPVTINAVCPGWVDTDMALVAVERIAAKTDKTVEQARQALERMSPQRRMVKPEEVAHTVASLCHEHARSIHGQAIVLDGGALMR